MRKTVSGTVLILLLTSMLSSALNIQLVKAESTTVSGDITTDTTWYFSESPYIVTGDVILFPGYTLAIEPGVTVLFYPNTRLIIRGILKADGTESHRITFTCPNGRWYGISIATELGGKATIRFANFYNASTAVYISLSNPGYPVVEIYDSVFANNSIGLGGYVGSGGTLVEKCTFENNTYGITQADYNVYNSVFKKNDYGLYATERVNVYYSTFVENQVALYGGRGEVKYSQITNNGIGVQSFFEGFTLSNNIITNNDVGVILGQYDTYSAPVEYNDIYNNVAYNLKNIGDANKFAKYNWWGTTDPYEIEIKIYDGYDDASVGVVEYSPILTGPQNTAPSAIEVDRAITTGPGGIFKDTTWTLSESPYIITEDLTLFPGYTLTIQPGVEVKFSPSTKLTIRGSLVAEGTESKRIVFTSTEPGTKGSWDGIDVATHLGANASIKFADFSYAQTAIYVHCCWKGGPVNIYDSMFTDNVVALGGYAGWEMTVERCIFERNIYAVTSADKRISNSIFKNNDYGLYATERISVYSSTFTENQVALYGGRGEVKNCEISNNNIGVQSFFEGFTLSQNTIKYNDIGVILGQYDTYFPPVYLNNFINNAIQVKNPADTPFHSPEKITYTYNGKTYTNYLGNYWSDYTGSDADGDGIGDASYVIDSNKDDYPLMEPFENYLAPTPPPVPKFLTLPFRDPDIKIQQGWVYTFDPDAHKGIDYIKGTIDQRATWQSFDVVAAADGWAMWSEQPGSVDVYGKFVLIRHDVQDPEGNDYFTLYAHLQSVSAEIPYQDRHSIDYNYNDASKWKYVKRGEIIGRAGNTGASNRGNHLHFEVQRGEYFLDKTDPYDLYKTRDFYPGGSSYVGSGPNHLWTTDPPTTPPVSENDIYWLAKAIMSEASIGTVKEQIAVGWTVINRLDSGRFGSSIEYIVKNGYAYNQEPTEEVKALAKKLLERQIQDPTEGAMYFFSPRSMPKEGEDTTGFDVGGGLHQVPFDDQDVKVWYPSWAKPEEGMVITEDTIRYLTDEKIPQKKEWRNLSGIRNWYFMFYRPFNPRVDTELGSPGELRVYDSQGRVTGLVNETVVIEIPESVYFEDTVIIFFPNDTYQYVVAGTTEELYGLTVTAITTQDNINFSAIDIPTSDNEVHQYTIEWGTLSQGEEGVTVQVDSDGDGVFERTFASDSELTRSEYLAALGDLNGDGVVDINDIAVAGLAFGSFPGHPRWNPIVDVNKDNKIDIYDLVIIATNFGKTCQ